MKRLNFFIGLLVIVSGVFILTNINSVAQTMDGNTNGSIRFMSPALHSISPTYFNVTTGFRQPAYRNMSITNLSGQPLTYNFSSYPQRWIVIEMADRSGTIPANGNKVIPIAFEPHNYAEGTVLTGNITLTTSDPQQPTDIIPCQLRIIEP